MKLALARITFISLLILATTSVFAATQETKHNGSIEDTLTTILVQQKSDEPGVSILVRKDNEIVFQMSKGLANKTDNISINSRTGFRIGSISKPFTALAIMQLVEQNRLRLDDPITLYLTDLPFKWSKITIRHLLSHRVYISNDFFSDSNLQRANESTNKHVKTFLSSNRIKVKSLASENAIYCNACFVLLAELIAEVSKISFSDYLHKNIFIPANMKNTYIVTEGVSMRLDDALNYAKTESFFGIKQYTTGAMAQVSSIEDLNHFIIALKSGKIISQKSLRLMTQVHSDAGDDGTFGLGWFIGWGEQPFYSHGGSQDGYQSELFIHPKHALEVVILTNGGDKTYTLQAKIMKAIINHYN